MLSAKIQRLVFRHLYDDKWGVIVKGQCSLARDKIIMPSNFQPVTGKCYNCHVRSTLYGNFHYQGKEYDLYLASLAEAGSVIDVVNYEFDKARKAPSPNPLNEALKAVKIDRSKLPNEHELILVEVQADRKNGGLMFKPQYDRRDPVADGRPSMTFFHSDGSKKVKLTAGQRWRVRIIRKERSGKTNRLGHEFINAHIIPLRQFKQPFEL